jgi:hypothetical protein
MDPFPTMMRKTLTYSSLFTLTTGAAQTFGSERAFALNSIFDPDVTATGHQPYGRDTLATLYGRYIVTACMVEITFSNPSADGVICGLLFRNNLNGTNILQANIPDAINEQPAGMTKIVNNTGAQTAIFRTMVPLHTAFGLTAQQYLDNTDRNGALFTDNPLNLYYVTVAAAEIGGTAQTVMCNVKLSMQTRVFERLSLPQS